MVCFNACVESNKTDMEVVQMASLQTLTSLCSGNPDIVTKEGRQLFLTLLQSCTNAGIGDKNMTLHTIQILRLIRITCTMHETGRQSYVTLGLIPLLMKILDMYKSVNSTVIHEACAALRILTVDDDMRATFGKAHDHAKIIVTEEKALAKLIEICKRKLLWY